MSSIRARLLLAVLGMLAVTALGVGAVTYRSVRALTEADEAALPLFVAVRQFWLLGEYAGRVPVWGSQAMSTGYLQRQVKLLGQWEGLELPVA